jgi:CubicO group peptidase (beta-lactamase class C family)
MLERVMDQPWESLMEELVLEPLQMRNTTPLTRVDPQQFTAPGGGIIATMEDYAKFCIFHMQFNADNVLGIKRKDFEKMHEPVSRSNYGLGFFALSKSWSTGVVLQHTGRDRQCLSTFWLAPQEGFGIFAVVPGSFSDSSFWNEVINYSIDEML